MEISYVYNKDKKEFTVRRFVDIYFYMPSFFCYILILLITGIFVQMSIAYSPPIVSNIRVQRQGKLKIIYDLEDKDSSSLTVMLLVSFDKGRNFEQRPFSISEDIGCNITPGKDKMIIWDIKEDFDLIGLKPPVERRQICVGVFASDGLLTSDGTEMVLVPYGDFYMGSQVGKGNPNERPRHLVFSYAFYIDKYEVTNAQFYDFWKADGEYSSAHTPKSYGEAYNIGNWPGVCLDKPDFPVIGITWDDALTYARSRRKRLPTETEWEKAALGNDSRKWPWGNKFNEQINGTTVHANTWNNNDDYDNTTSQVGYYPTGISPYGLYDMSGNVWEWCLDWYDPDYYAHAPKVSPTGPAKGEKKVIRGGSWYNGSEIARGNYRTGVSPERSSYSIGFRCVRDFVNPNLQDEGISWSEPFFIYREERPCDINLDGLVNIQDMVIVGSHFGQSGEEILGDINDDGVVNIFDLVLIGIHFGE